MTEPLHPAADLNQSLQANNLGNGDDEWQLRPGIIVSYDASKMVAQGTYDGDTAPIPMIALIGDVTVGERVFVLRVPPSGNYIIAHAMNTGYAYSTVDAAGVSTASTTYVGSGGGITSNGTTFTAPASGAVEVSIRASTVPAAGAQAWMSVRVGEDDSIGSGTVFQAGSDNYAIMLSGTSIGSDMGTTFPITGLTPGKSYNIQLAHRTTGGTSFWARRQITVSPIR